MTADDQLLYEARVRPRQAVIAGVAATALLAASITQLVGPHSKVNELTIGLITEHKRMGLDLLGAAFQAIGSLTVAWTLVFLFGATKARNPKLPSFLRILAIVGGVTAAVAGIISAVLISIKSDRSSRTATRPMSRPITSPARRRSWRRRSSSRRPRCWWRSRS